MATGIQNNRTNLHMDKLSLEWKETWACNSQMCKHQNRGSAGEQARKGDFLLIMQSNSLGAQSHMQYFPPFVAKHDTAEQSQSTSY